MCFLTNCQEGKLAGLASVVRHAKQQGAKTSEWESSLERLSRLGVWNIREKACIGGGDSAVLGFYWENTSKRRH